MVGKPVRRRILAKYFSKHHEEQWKALGGVYDKDIDSVNIVAHEGNMKLDVQMFKSDDMEAVYEAAFAAFYGVDVKRAEDMLRMYLLRRASLLIQRYSKSSKGTLTWPFFARQRIQKSSSVLTTLPLCWPTTSTA